MKLKFLDLFSENAQIRTVGTKLFRADTRTERHDEVNSRFWQFC